MLLAAPWIRDRVGDIALELLTRVFGLLLAAIAAQFIVVGLGEVFPNWVSYDSQIHDDLQESVPGSS